MESSARLRNTNSRGEENLIYPSNLRLMCSNGGHIVPRPHDKSLCYIGGETRMVVVDRHTTLLELKRRLSKTFLQSSSSSKATSAKGDSFNVKYQLPSEDLDSLISVTTDEDLENMIEEYERLNSSSRLRLFIFPTNPESVCSIGSFLENSIRSEDWFLNALNGSSSGFSDTSSVNCLLGLYDEISVPEKKNVNQNGTTGANLRGNNSGQDVHSIPDSPMMETSSSFGSTSSTPSLANLPPIADDHPKHQNERSDQVLQMAYLSHHHQEQQQQLQLQLQQKQSTGFDLAPSDSVLSDLSDTNNRLADTNDTPDQQMQHSACSLSMPATHIDSSCNQLHHQQPHFIPPLQYIQHHPWAVPVAPYYQHQPHHPPIDQQNFVYYMPARQLPQGFNFPLQQPQPSHADPSPAATIPPIQTILKTESPAGVYRTRNSGAPQAVMNPSNCQNQPQYVGYSEIHQPSQLIYYAPPFSAAQYEK